MPPLTETIQSYPWEGLFFAQLIIYNILKNIIKLLLNNSTKVQLIPIGNMKFRTDHIRGGIKGLRLLNTCIYWFIYSLIENKGD